MFFQSCKHRSICINILKQHFALRFSHNTLFFHLTSNMSDHHFLSVDYSGHPSLSLFHRWLESHLFHKSFHHRLPASTIKGLPSLTRNKTESSVLIGFVRPTLGLTDESTVVTRTWKVVFLIPWVFSQISFEPVNPILCAFRYSSGNGSRIF